MKVPGPRSSYYPLIILLVVVVMSLHGKVHAVEIDFQGQLSGWTRETKTSGAWENSSGLRYIPQATFARGLKKNRVLDSEISLNCLAVTGSGPHRDDIDLGLYRINLRYVTSQTETRIGLQKINFGPARLLRPLRWFDRLDPTDPLQLTEGVYALRFRYSTLTNASLWIWGLYGNDDPKGFELLPTPSDTLEAGGRFQRPMLRGDLAVTLHTRRVNGSRAHIPDFRENRFALDGRWDFGIGLWFESAFQHQRTSHVPYEWTKRSTLGIDYTFDIGNGLYMLLEHMGIGLSNRPLGWKEDLHISAFSIDYPVGILDNLTAIGYYYHDWNKYYQYLNWARTYDSITINFSLFYYPETGQEGSDLSQIANMGGRGCQLMIVFNH